MTKPTGRALSRNLIILCFCVGSGVQSQTQSTNTKDPRIILLSKPICWQDPIDKSGPDVCLGRVAFGTLALTLGRFDVIQGPPGPPGVPGRDASLDLQGSTAFLDSPIPQVHQEQPSLIARGSRQATSAAFSIMGGPHPAKALSSECPPQVNPFMWVQDVNLNYHSQAGIDTVTTDPIDGPPAPAGTLVFCRRIYFNDTQILPQSGKNAFISINHMAGVGTVATNQDRALWITVENPINDTATRYALEGIQVEADFNGTPTFSGHPDGEVSAGSFQLNDAHIGTIAAPGLGLTAVRAHAFRNSPGSMASCGACMTGIAGIAQNNSTDSYDGGMIVGGAFAAVSEVTPYNIGGVGVYILDPVSGGGIRMTYNYGTYIRDFGTNINDYNIFSLGSANSGRNRFQGPVIVDREIRTGQYQNTDLAGAGTLNGGTFVYWFVATNELAPICTANDTTALAPVRPQVTAKELTLMGTPGDQVSYICVSRN
jgi:hypothetical protein